MLILYVTMGFRHVGHYFTDIHWALKSGDLDKARAILGLWRGSSCERLSVEEVVRLTIEEALVASYQHVFAVVFWFVVLPGPSGAILYRLSAFLVAYDTGAGWHYFPSLGEMTVTVGMIAFEVLGIIVAIKLLPILPAEPHTRPS